jgi:hypothetical protein
MEFNKDYFDAQFSELARDIKAIKETMATKQDVHDAVENLAGMIERTVNVSERVERLESDIRIIKQALHIQ